MGVRPADPSLLGRLPLPSLVRFQGTVHTYATKQWNKLGHKTYTQTQKYKTAAADDDNNNDRTF